MYIVLHTLPLAPSVSVFAVLTGAYCNIRVRLCMPRPVPHLPWCDDSHSGQSDPNQRNTGTITIMRVCWPNHKAGKNCAYRLKKKSR